MIEVVDIINHVLICLPVGHIGDEVYVRLGSRGFYGYLYVILILKRAALIAQLVDASFHDVAAH